MHLEPREMAAVESYPTFWVEDAPTPPVPAPMVPPEEAHAAFVDLSEEEFPEDVVASNA